jgi:hypothetical protein
LNPERIHRSDPRLDHGIRLERHLLILTHHVLGRALLGPDPEPEASVLALYHEFDRITGLQAKALGQFRQFVDRVQVVDSEKPVTRL